MKKTFLFLLLTVAISFISIAQKNTAIKCKCTYPFKPSCWDTCVKQLLQNPKFKKVVAKSRLSDSTRAKMESWSNNAGGQSLKSLLNQTEVAKVDASLQSYYDNHDNNERSSSPFMQSVGVTVSVLFGKLQSSFDPTYSSSFTLSQRNFVYFPRYNFIQGENSSLSVGAPVGIGVGIVSNTSSSDIGVAFAYDLPMVLDFNFGCMSTRNAESTFGGYVGAGFGYYHVSISQSSYSNFSGATYGPMGRVGVRFSKEGWNDKAVTIGAFYKKGLEKDKLQTVGFNVLYDF